MTKLNQIIAIANGTKARTTSAVTEVYKTLQKDTLLHGIIRTYRPKDEEGDRLPDEKKLVQTRVETELHTAREAWSRLFDLVATQDEANCNAKGKLLEMDLPVPTLLFLEKQLTDVRTMIGKLPTLDTSDTWKRSAESDCWATEVSQTTRTKKIPKAFVKYDATKEHPAQVDTFTEDIIVGTWDTVKLSGAIPETDRRRYLAKVEQLIDLVKQAREQANETEVTDVVISDKIFDYIFGDTAS